jgi:hypothetical protein
MSTITFDTLKFADTLKAAGIPDKQAEAQARAVAEAFSTNASELATKADVRDLRSEMELMRRDMLTMEQRLTIKLGAFLAVFAGIIIAALKAF